MGIELGTDKKFDGVCDGCRCRASVRAQRAITAQKQLRDMGWRRGRYVSKLQHYRWLCPKCMGALDVDGFKRLAG